MPAIAVAAAAWIGEAITAIGATIGAASIGASIGAAAANFVAALGFAQGIGAALTAWSTVASLAALASGPPKLGSGASGTQVQFKADKNAGIPVVVGETGTGGNIIFADVAGSKNSNLHYLTVLSLGPIAAITGFQANNVALNFDGAGAVVGSSYSGKMWQKNTLGSLVPAAFNPPGPGALFEWDSTCLITGLAASWWVEAYDQGKYPTGTPKPLWIVQGVACYDPRLDSTYPGGVGPQRIADPTTWTYSENPALHALTFALGRYQNGKRITGLGAPASFIDIPAFVTAANVADANGWKVGGTYSTADSKAAVLAAMLACGGAWPVSLGAQLSCGVSTPRVSLATLTKDDAAGAVTIGGVQPRRDRLNGVIPSYRSAANGYDIVPAARIGVAAYETADGEQRTKEIEWSLCPSVNQVAQLARYTIEDSREFGPIVIPAKPRWMGYRPNDVITVDEPEWNLSAQKCMILKRDRDPATGIVTLTLRSETDAKHPFALGQTGTAPPAPSMQGFDANTIAPPDPGSFAVLGATITGTAGAIPALVVTGANDNPHAGQLAVQYKPHSSPTWVNAPLVDAPPLGTSVRIEVTGVTSGGQYDVQIGYISVRGIPSTFASLGTVTAGAFNLAIYDAALSDGVLTPSEKSQLIPQINALINARAALRTRADGYGLTVAAGNADRINFENAATNLDAYLATLTAPVLWSDTSGNTTVAVPATFRTRIQDAATYETNLQTAIDTAAAGQIGNALSDGVLTPAEKRDFIPRINALQGSRTGLRARADAVGLTSGVSAERLNYENAATALDSWLAGLTAPVAWNNTTGNTTIANPATARTVVQNAQQFETDLQAAVDAIYAGRTQYQNLAGQTLDYRGYYYGYSISGVAGRGGDPLSSVTGEIDVAAHDIILPGVSGNITLHVPAHTMTGLLNDHDYVVFYRPDFGDWFPIQAEFSPAFYTSRDGYLWIGNIRTPTTGGTYTPPSTDFSTTGRYSSFACVDENAWLSTGIRASDAKAGDPLRLMTPAGDGLLDGSIGRVHIARAKRVRLTTAQGAVLTVSVSAPIMTRVGKGYLPHAVRADLVRPGMAVPILKNGKLVWDVLTSRRLVGWGRVARISADSGIYAAGDRKDGPFILTHNSYSKALA